MLRTHNKPETNATGFTGALTIQAADGTPLCNFPAPVIDNCRRMITHLAYRNEFPKRLAVTSTLREEGVTFLSLAMGVVLAHDFAANVGVVELNWLAPGMYNHLATAAFSASTPSNKRGKRNNGVELARVVKPASLPDDHGVGAVLDGGTALESAIIPTLLPNFELLPAGNVAAERRAALARSDELRSLIDGLSERYEYLVLDIPAITATSDAVALASLADASCMVVRQGVTPTNKVRAALADLSHLTVLGVVLNQVQLHAPGWIRTLIPQE